jgi:hypothetical protein
VDENNLICARELELVAYVPEVAQRSSYSPLKYLTRAPETKKMSTDVKIESTDGKVVTVPKAVAGICYL